MKINKKNYFIVILALSVATKSYKLNTCGAKVESDLFTEQDISCYDSQEIDDLKSVDVENIADNSIFFIETSCKGGLNIREACSVEAAAKVNPQRQVYVLFAGAVHQRCVHDDPLASLLSYKNVQLARIYSEEFALSTGLDYVLQSVAINQSPYPVLYALDYLKFITLYKFGGVYMNMDMLATRPFNELPFGDNWFAVGDHSRGELSSAIMSLSKNDVGRKLANTIISLLKDHQQDSLEVDIRNVIKEGVESICGVVPFTTTDQDDSFTCHGLMLYARKFFIPVPCKLSKQYFASTLNIANLTKSFTQRLCNNQNYYSAIPRNSTYDSLMHQYCPKIYNYFKKIEFKEQSESVKNFSEAEPVLNADEVKESTNAGSSSAKSKWFHDIVEKHFSNNSYCKRVWLQL